MSQGQVQTHSPNATCVFSGGEEDNQKQVTKVRIPQYFFFTVG